MSARSVAERPSGRFLVPEGSGSCLRRDPAAADLLLCGGSLPTMFTRKRSITRTARPRSYNRVLWTLSTSTQATRLKVVVVTR